MSSLGQHSSTFVKSLARKLPKSTNGYLTQNILRALRKIERKTLGIENHQSRSSFQSQPGNSKSKSEPTNFPPRVQDKRSPAKPNFKTSDTKTDNCNGLWSLPEESLSKLEQVEANKLAEQGLCFRCRGSVSRASDVSICLKKNVINQKTNLEIDSAHISSDGDSGNSVQLKENA
ncbi:hypothetical protein Golomagni_01503 [Golovinomyces magnicellulatus]|nr:hypothetical protein Golomagni_01503 [Golovinomyces magnicellulatus]